MALVGRYESYERLGKESTGTVYRGRDTVLGREVALKILNGNARISSRLLHLFSTTGQAAPEWLHPNIAIIYDLGESDVGSFVATELLTGADLRTHIRNRRALSLVQKLDILAQACDGLAHAHKNGIVHGAITPGSFFIDEKHQVKILNLGIRQAGDVPAAGGEDSDALDYLAPEQIGQDTYDVRSDIFSAALVFYEFLVNVHPFEAAFIPRRIVEDAPDSLLGHDPRLPHSLEVLLNRSLSKSPEDRPQTALEMASSLRAIELEVRSNMTARVADPPRILKQHSAAVGSSPENHSDARAFIELLRQYEGTLVSGKWSEAQDLLQRMQALISTPDNVRFARAIRDCETRLDHARGSDAPYGSAVIEPVPSRRDVRKTPQFPSGWLSAITQLRFRFLSFPSFGIQLLGTVLVAVFLLSAAFLASQSRQGRRHPVLAQAQVHVLQTSLLESPNANSRPLRDMKIGTWVKILDRVPSRGDNFAHVQFMPDRKTSSLGYVRVADLGEWRSDDPAAAWEVLSLTKPVENARTDDIKQYLADLQSYTDRFPTAGQAHAVEVERKRWETALTAVRQVQPAQLPRQDQVPADPAEAIQASPDASPPPAPLSVQDQEKVQRLLDQIPGLWNDGNLEGVVDLSQQAIGLDPNNPQAKGWRVKARKALRKLNDQ